MSRDVIVLHMFLGGESPCGWVDKATSNLGVLTLKWLEEIHIILSSHKNQVVIYHWCIMGIMDSYAMLRSVTIPLAIKQGNDIEHHKWRLKKSWKIMETHIWKMIPLFWSKKTSEYWITMDI